MSIELGLGSSLLDHRQSPTNERAFLEVHVSRKAVPACHWSGEGKSSDALKKLKRKVQLSLHHPSPKSAALNAKGDTLGTEFLLQGKVRAYQLVPIFPAVQEAAKEAHFSLTHPED